MKLSSFKVVHENCTSEIEIDEEGKLTGKGEVVYNDGVKFAGIVDEQGYPNGKGVVTYVNNDTLEGRFNQDCSMVGVGRYTPSKKFSNNNSISPVTFNFSL